MQGGPFVSERDHSRRGTGQPCSGEMAASDCVRAAKGGCARCWAWRGRWPQPRCTNCCTAPHSTASTLHPGGVQVGAQEWAIVLGRQFAHCPWPMAALLPGCQALRSRLKRAACDGLYLILHGACSLRYRQVPPGRLPMTARLSPAVRALAGVHDDI